ncbi:PREDICTED: fructose-bisphosphate aldolase-like [Polistes dominula]|uniref:fructose-bisphosphate aldolase n=1 Tax=Polistes dominula TaxID=743375 RepID=A0ABM1IW75_POLDO|nr:PREDICTED: fructose-bisphosphate aldolase-like [Polistes dominula]
MASAAPRCFCKDKVSEKFSDLDAASSIELKKIIETLSVPGKGLLASDESPMSLNDTFGEIGIENTENSRREYRQMLFSAYKPELTKYISGIILHHETLYQKTTDGINFAEFLQQRNIVPGIKVDQGLINLCGTEEELTTEGLDNLKERCIQYKREGCYFTKWRCVYSISETKPSQLLMSVNANTLARYATICQRARLVPIVEPEILTTGEHSIEKALQIHEQVLSILFRAFNEHRVYLEGMILKPAMVLPGVKNIKKYTPQIVAEYTLKALQRTVPPAVPTILFLSNGQATDDDDDHDHDHDNDNDSILNLNAINMLEGKKPWTLSFCYGRCLQNEVLKTWKGNVANVEAAHSILLGKAKLCSEASLGKLSIQNVRAKNIY